MHPASLVLGVLAGALLAAAVLARWLLAAGARVRRSAGELDRERTLRAGEQERHAAELQRLAEHHGAQLRSAKEQVALVQATREQLRDELKAISADVLKATGDSLAARMGEQRRADQERATGEMARRTEEIKGLVRPVAEQLGRVESEIARVERERRQSHGQLAEVLRQLHEGVGGLRAETGNLVSALKRPSTRGAWGEIQLRNVIEMAGMVAHCDFVEQSTISSSEGVLRPDVLVRLPGGKVIVVDAKVPLDAYLAHLEARSDEERDLELARHARQTREHITKLASKGYQRQFESTPELVVMFVPSDGIYQAALAQDPALIEHGVQQQVLLATPTTLIGLLRAVHYGWRQEQVARSARELAHAGRELHHRLGRFVTLLASVGRRLDSAVGAYNEAVGSLDRSVMPQVRRIERAGAQSDRELEAPAPVESVARPVLARGPEDPDDELPPGRGEVAASRGVGAGATPAGAVARRSAADAFQDEVDAPQALEAAAR
jgi:DNA recombination protein RmuC